MPEKARDPFSPFDTISACDGQTYGRTHAVANIELVHRLEIKILVTRQLTLLFVKRQIQCDFWHLTTRSLRLLKYQLIRLSCEHALALYETVRSDSSTVFYRTDVKHGIGNEDQFAVSPVIFTITTYTFSVHTTTTDFLRLLIKHMFAFYEFVASDVCQIGRIILELSNQI